MKVWLLVALRRPHTKGTLSNWGSSVTSLVETNDPGNYNQKRFQAQED